MLSMDRLVFLGHVRSGVGRYKDLVFPSRDLLSQAPPDWPQQLYPGSLNVRIREDGYPPEFSRLGTLPGVCRLDEKRFQPTFVIPRDRIANNLLGPTPRHQDGGDAQVWRAQITVVDSGAAESCWLVRRIGSGLSKDLELVSHKFLRLELDLVDGTAVRVEVKGKWN